MNRRRVAVIATALVIRLVIAFVTFGSVETIANFRDTVRLLHGLPISAPYLPGVEFWIRAASVIAMRTTLPVAFPHKLLPVVFDALIALLLFDSARDARTATRRGLAYAFSVVAIIVCAIQPQWDSVFLFFLLLSLVLLRSTSAGADASAGAAFALSVIAKPVAAPLLILLLPWTWRRARSFIGGGAVTTTLYAGFLTLIHALPTLDDLRGIASYASRGVLLFGLPYRPWNRMVMVLATVVILAALHAWKKLDRETCVLLYFAAAIGFSGLCPQYLTWVVPFALLAGRERFFAIYSLVAGAFLVFYFELPVLNLPDGENLGAFALLRPLGHFSPTLPSLALLPLARFLGNFAVPLLCLGLVGFEIARALLKGPDLVSAEDRPARLLITPAFIALLVFAGAIGWAALPPPLRSEAFVVEMQQRIDAYDVARWHGPTMMAPGSKIWVARGFVEPEAGSAVANIATLLLAWTVVSAGVAWSLAQKKTAG